jgi:transposase-like protein
MEAEHRQPESGQGRKTERREHRKYHRFTEEFKREAVRLTQQPNKTVAGVARTR